MGWRSRLFLFVFALTGVGFITTVDFMFFGEWREPIWDAVSDFLAGGAYAPISDFVRALTTTLVYILPDVAIGIAFYMLGEVFLLQIQHDARRLTGKCLNCGYDLRGSTNACPECGQKAPRVSRASDVE